MDKKVELQVLNITNSQAQVGAFALLLGDENICHAVIPA